MTWADVRANWRPLADQMHRRWSNLTAEDIVVIGGRRHELIARLRERYDLDEQSAASQADAFVSSLQVLSL